MPLLICLAASALVHAGVVLTLASPGSFLASILQQNHVADPDSVRLGIEDSVPVSIAWIGFTESTPHAAVKAETLQPELSVDAIAASARAADQAVRQVTSAAVQASESLLERLSDAAEMVAKMQRLSERTQQAEKAVEAENPNEAEQQAKSTLVPPAEQAIKDDREADATSPVVQVKTRDLGKVLARQGLRIQTFRPKFDATTKVHELRVRQGSVTAVIQFAKDGSVLAASIKPGTESGHPTIDEPILDSVYRWRASGKDLEVLPDSPGAGLTVEIQILF